MSIKERAFNDQCVKYFKNDGGQAIRRYLAASGGVTQQFLRESAAAVGLVDYKICSVDETWSAMLFARRKPV